MGALHALPPGDLRERRRRLERAFEEEGVATVLAPEAAGPGAPSPIRRPWRCDAVPLVLPAAEFAELEAGLAQRASLFEALLQDLYGPQRLLAEGAVPPALVFGNPFFLRGCRAPRGPDGVPRLSLYAADLLRGPDGAWRVLTDRCGGPSGIGFARENRALLSRVLPEAFRVARVRALRPFFDLWLDALQRLAPPGADNPRLALLTPGAGQDTWLEHLFLSRELGLDLVEAGDLTVRDGAVFLKTLRGLRRVDVILRRVKGEACDPLEFSPGGPGVPGLMDAWRTGAVRLANDPGAMLAEAPGLLPFLPRCAELLLGDGELRLPSLETLWLGDAAAQDRWRRAEPGEWRLRGAFDPSAETGADELSLSPHAVAATRPVLPSTLPHLGEEGLAPAGFTLRIFLARGPDGAWRAMPGGLATLLDGEAGPLARPPSRRGLAKDVWVLTEDEMDIVGPAGLRTAPLEIRRGGMELPSRLADDLYWLGRTLERLESAARLLRALLVRLMRGPALPRDMAEMGALARCLRAAALLDAEAAASPPDGTALPRALLAIGGSDGPLAALFDQLERLQSAVRDRLTPDMSGALASLAQDGRAQFAAAAAAGSTTTGADAMAEATTGLIRASTAVAGMAAENMVRGGAWLFLDLGRRIERAAATARSLGHVLDQPPARLEAGLRLALELCDSALTYRSRYLAALQAAPVLDLVLADPDNPRALAYQLRAAAERLAQVGGDGDPLAAEVARLAGRPEALVASLARPGDAAGDPTALPRALLALEGEIAALSDAVARRYVSHVQARTLAAEDGGGSGGGG